MRRRGFYGIGIWQHMHESNVGGLMRSAYAFGASFVFTIGRRYHRTAADTPNTPRQLPLFHFADLDDCRGHLPLACPLVGVEIAHNARPLHLFCHPDCACYLLGRESGGLPEKVLAQCHHIVQIPFTSICLNVSSAASIVLFHRAAQKDSTGRKVG
jgi:tRNA G18 (ribose-2'-O)-methylase SpoU